MLRLSALVLIGAGTVLSNPSPARCEGAPDCISINAKPSRLQLPGIGVDTKYLTGLRTTTMWIGSNPDYITLEPVTTTTNNAPVTTTRTVRIDVAPPTSPVDGPKIASIGVTLSHSALKDLENLAGRLCGSGKRQTCALRQDELATGLLRYIEGTLHVFNAQKLATNLEIGVTVIAGGIALATAKEYIQTGRISRPNFGLNSGSLKQRYTSASSTTSSVATTVLDDNPDSPFTDTDHAYKSVAQEVIAMISREASDGPMFGPRATEAWCLHGAAPNHAREPKEYCACGDKHATYYSVAKSTSSPYIPCPYTKPPGAPIAFSTPVRTTSSSTPASSPSPQCGVKRSGDLLPLPWLPYRVAMYRDSLVKAFTDFCTVNDKREISNGVSHTYGPWGMGDSLGARRQNIYIKARSYTNDRDCALPPNLNAKDCKSAFSALADGCDTNTMLNLKQGGHSDWKCITYDLVGTGGVDYYRLHLHQKMERETSSLEWTMYNSRGQKISGPSTDARIPIKGASHEVKLTVDSPNNEDATNVRLSYAAEGNWPFASKWSTGWTGKANSQSYSVFYWCEDVLTHGKKTYWKPLNSGVERDFDCYFPAWQANDMVLG